MKPTAWLKELPPEDGNGMMMTTFEEVAKEWEEPVIPLYSKDAWVGLTDEEIEDCFDDEHLVHARNIERLLKDKNT
jgi:hypothetical protein